MKSPIKLIAKIVACIVVAIFVLGMLFGKQFREAHLRDLSERHIRRDLGGLRSNVEIYRIDHEQKYPTSLEDPYFASHNLRVPELWFEAVCPHAATDECLTLTDKVVNDTGKWVYIYNPESDLHGEVYIDCRHKDSKGKAWHEY